MGIVEVIIICAGLSVDNMAVAAAAGSGQGGFNFPLAVRAAAVFCMVSMVCIVLGWAGGSKIESFLGSWDHWIAFGLLVYLGAKMVREACSDDEDSEALRIGSVKSLAIFALATNIDVLAVGVTIALYKVSLPVVMGILAACVFSGTLFGFALGSRLGARFGDRAGAVGGFVLIAIAFKILLQAIF